mgnify:FL=1
MTPQTTVVDRGFGDLLALDRKKSLVRSVIFNRSIDLEIEYLVDRAYLSSGILEVYSPESLEGRLVVKRIGAWIVEENRDLLLLEAVG